MAQRVEWCPPRGAGAGAVWSVAHSGATRQHRLSRRGVRRPLKGTKLVMEEIWSIPGKIPAKSQGFVEEQEIRSLVPQIWKKIRRVYDNLEVCALRHGPFLKI